jgi:hypothetical protein
MLFGKNMFISKVLPFIVFGHSVHGSLYIRADNTKSLTPLICGESKTNEIQVQAVIPNPEKALSRSGRDTSAQQQQQQQQPQQQPEPKAQQSQTSIVETPNANSQNNQQSSKEQQQLQDQINTQKEMIAKYDASIKSYLDQREAYRLKSLQGHTSS